MALTPGQRLGPYEISGPLGAGGMGEVYRGRDLRLGRSVAVKVLPAHLSADQQWRERFEREARMVSSINHPNICVLHDLGSDSGVDYLVMELIEGETLGQRLSRGPMAIGEVLRVAADIAGALAAAHRRGIVHRDLKPGNVMLTPDGVKLLDFGLAKPSGPVDGDRTRMDLTGEGMVVGTLFYMAPEQLEGKAVDSRGDVFAFGALLYEMLSGRKAFEGESQASVIAAILSGPRPPIPPVAASEMPLLEHLVGTCLERDPEQRRHSAKDLETDLRWLAQQKSAAAGKSEAPQRNWLLKSAVLVLAAAALAGWASFGLAPASSGPGLLTYWIHAPANAQIIPRGAVAGGSAISPDGTMLVFAASSGGRTRLWTRHVDTLETKMLPGTEGAYSPFWSPDGRSIGFFTLGSLRRVDLGGSGGARTIAAAPVGDGGSWGSKGVIVFARAASGGLYRVSAEGGVPEAITTLDATRHEYLHTWAEFLPDGEHFLFTALSSDADGNRVLAGSIAAGHASGVVSGLRSRVRYVPGAKRFGLLHAAGALIYVRDQGLAAQAFDAQASTLSGDITAIPGSIATQEFSVSANGIVVMGATGVPDTQLVWRDREGKQTGVAGEPGFDHYPSLSRDSSMLATARVTTENNSRDVWVTNLERNARTRLTFSPGMDAFPVWSPDGKTVLYGSSRDGYFGLFYQMADGVDQAHALAGGQTGAHQVAWDWSADGATVLYSGMGASGRWRLHARPAGDGEARPLSNPEFNSTQGQFSPDGHFIAFVSDRTGRDEVYLQTYSASPGAAVERWSVSTEGGSAPRWRSDGKELYLIDAEGELNAISVKLNGTKAEIGAAHKLFRIAPPNGALAIPYAVAPAHGPGVGRDERFLVVAQTESAADAGYTVIRGWRR